MFPDSFLFVGNYNDVTRIPVYDSIISTLLIYRLLKLFSIFSEKTTNVLLHNAIWFYNETEEGWHKSGSDVGDFQGLRQLCFNSQERPSMLPNFSQLNQVTIFHLFFLSEISLFFIGNSSKLCVFSFQLTKAELPEEANNVLREQFLENCCSRICLV